MTQLNTTVTITARDETREAFNSVKQKLDGLHSTLAKFKGSIFGSFLGANVALSALQELAKAIRVTADAIYDNTVKWQTWEYTLEAGGLSAQQTKEQLTFLTKTANELGLNIKDMGQSFGRFILTGLTSGASLQKLDSDFLAIAQAMRVFHLSGQQATRSWLALNEVMAMGHLQSRQYTQQLGRDWAGIGPLLAKNFGAAGGNIAKFIELMKEGKITGQQFMDIFPKLMDTPAMKGALAGSENSIQAATGRLSNAWFELTNEAGNTTALNEATKAIDGLATTLNDPSVKQAFDQIISWIATLAEEIVKSGSKIINWISDFGDGIANVVVKMKGLPVGTESLVNDIKRLKDEIASLQEQENNPHSAAIIPYLQQEIEAKQKQLAALQFALTHPQLTPKPNADASPSGFAPISTIDTSDFGSVSKKSLFDQYNEALNQFKSNYQVVLQMQDKIQKLQTQDSNLADKHEVAGMSSAMSLINQQIDASPQHIQQVETDIQAMVGQTVNGIVFTSQMATKAIDQLKDHSDASQKQLSAFGEEAARNIQDSLAKLFMNSDKSWKAWLRDLVRSFEQSMAQLVASKALNSLFGAFDKSGKGSGDAGLATLIAGMFGGGKAGGGDVNPNSFYLVGEQGPELFMPNSSGRIINNATLAGMGGSSHFETHVNVDARGAGPDEVAKLLAMRNDIIATVRGDTEFRLQRGNWRSNNPSR